MSPDKRLTLVAQATGIAMVHFFVFMTAAAFSMVESGSRPFVAQSLMYVLGFPLVPLVFLVPANFAFFQSLGHAIIGVRTRFFRRGETGDRAPSPN